MTRTEDLLILKKQHLIESNAVKLNSIDFFKDVLYGKLKTYSKNENIIYLFDSEDYNSASILEIMVSILKIFKTENIEKQILFLKATIRQITTKIENADKTENIFVYDFSAKNMFNDIDIESLIDNNDFQNKLNEYEKTLQPNVLIIFNSIFEKIRIALLKTLNTLHLFYCDDFETFKEVFKNTDLIDKQHNNLIVPSIIYHKYGGSLDNVFIVNEKPMLLINIFSIMEILIFLNNESESK